MNTRNSNFELMRILSMMFIILWHIFTHGRFIGNCANPTLSIFISLMMYVMVVHVNSFVMVTGFFQSKSRFKLSKFIKLILQVMFFTSIFFVVCVKIGWIENYNLATFINSILPSTVSNYWFINTYLILYAFSDYINKFVDRLSRKEYKNIIIICFIIFSIVPYITGYKTLKNDGFTFYNFILLYMIGGYLCKYPLKDTYYFKRMTTNGYRICMIFIFVLMVLMNYFTNCFAEDINGLNSVFSEISSRISISKLRYSNPFAMIQTIAYFEFFRTLNFKNKLINFVSSCTFGIYLFHEYPAIRCNIYKFLKIDNGYFFGYKMFVYMLVIAVLIFIIGMILEIIRQLIFKLFSKLKPVKFIIRKFKSFVNSFNFKINW